MIGKQMNDQKQRITVEMVIILVYIVTVCRGHSIFEKNKRLALYRHLLNSSVVFAFQAIVLLLLLFSMLLTLGLFGSSAKLS